MTEKKMLSLCLKLLKQNGAEQAQCVLTKTMKNQMKAQAGQLSLLRSVADTELRLLAIKDGRQGQVSINTTGKRDVEAAVIRVIEAAKASPQDKAYGISEFQPTQVFLRGDTKADLRGMCRRLSEFLQDSRKYKGLRFFEAALGFTLEEKTFLNSNGVNLSSSIGTYDFVVEFSTGVRARASSINFSELWFKDLSRPLMECGSTALLFKQSGKSVLTTPVKDKFSGEILVSPECLGSFLGFLTGDALRDAKIIAGTSPYMNKIGSMVASAGFTLGSMPGAPEMAAGYFITGDGYKAENVPLVEAGRLKTFILSRYGAKKTGLRRTPNSGGCYIVGPGLEKLGSMVKAIKRGLLVTRFSGGAPNQKGDFSGVAKNSFYIENGKIKFPVSETMISGNIPAMFLGIKSISKERVNLGNAVYPWISFSGVSVSGK